MDCSPIGYVSTPFNPGADVPRQGMRGAVRGRITLEPDYISGLTGYDADRVLVVWFADRADRTVLGSDREQDRGIFSTRSQDRPNPICLTVCTVLDRGEDYLEVEGVDMFDGTPVLDLKPPLW